MKTSFQDSGSVICCYGCGSDNAKGLQIKSYWEGEGSICTWTPQPHHTAGDPHRVYGGIISCLIDCHSVNLAIATAYHAENREIGSSPKILYVSANLNVDFLKPTPIDVPLTLHATIQKIEGRKTWINCTVSANDTVTAKGQVLAVRLKEVV